MRPYVPVCKFLFCKKKLPAPTDGSGVASGVDASVPFVEPTQVDVL
jgi:hypothetical protein